MPLRRARAEARGEAVEEGAGQRDLRQQDQRLPAAPQRLGDRLEIDLRLAGAGDAVEQRDGEAVADGRRRSAAAARSCSADSAGRAWSGSRSAAIGRAGSGTSSSVPCASSPSITPGETPAAAASPDFDQARPSAASSSTRCRAGVMPLRRRAGEAHADHRPLRLQRLRRAEHHAQHHAARRRACSRRPSRRSGSALRAAAARRRCARSRGASSARTSSGASVPDGADRRAACRAARRRSCRARAAGRRRRCRARSTATGTSTETRCVPVKAWLRSPGRTADGDDSFH